MTSPAAGPDRREQPSAAGPGAGRFAPSPTSDLHVGNLRTALLAWLFARHSGRRFLVRIEDLDVTRVAHDPAVATRQLTDLRSLGLDWDGEVVRQSERTELYATAVEHLSADPGTYPCFCTRREIAEAASAPHTPPGAYPGTCRNLSPSERAARAGQRPAALRVRGDSMINAGILDGDIAVIEQKPVAADGEIVVAMIEDAVTLKRFFKEKGRIRLSPENPAYSPIFTQDVRILGKLRGIVRTY